MYVYPKGYCDMKILLELRTAIKPKKSDITFDDNRIEQYHNGLDSFYNVFSKINAQYKENCKIVLVDNTISSVNDIPSKLLSVIDKNTEVVVFDKNNYGKLNKGAGLIESWRECDEFISQYDYFFHYEPRLILQDSTFIQSFLNSPSNMFSLEEKNQHGWGVRTGYFGSKVEDLRSFYQSVDIDNMINRSISIEYMMFDHFSRLNTNFIRNYYSCLWNCVSDKNVWIKY